MRKDWPTLEEALEEHQEYLDYWEYDSAYSDYIDYEDFHYSLFEEENWEWWLDQVDTDAVNEVLGEDYY